MNILSTTYIYVYTYMHVSYNFATYTNFCRKDWWQKLDYAKIYWMKYFTNESFPDLQYLYFIV